MTLLPQQNQDWEQKQDSSMMFLFRLNTREPRPWHCCSAPSNKAQPLTKSVSADTCFPGIYPGGTCQAVPAHCGGCCHCHLPCHVARQSPSFVSSAYRPCSYSHNHLEVQFRKALNVLQDTTVRELYSVSIYLCKDGEADAATINTSGIKFSLPFRM